ncbi:MAG: hypothetical protein VR71_11820 [Roseovarius sp. BRH_c41]|uniref:DUF1850 domain-containing protein n=1 Tax=Roseovarius sp. BRH_c41 TaxID=1629709 RepID=UPI0005F1D710|nr:DUF1850 domain-containing protein [Roseovarius sp. BRH_c41]KJS43209.1 MAG: hypothetical protein VR71_11820 [Roseovarius sp. BRH_c41]
MTALLFLVASAVPAKPDRLLITRISSGEILADFDAPQGTHWSILWTHSVDGYEVEDVYENRAGRLMLVRSHMPDFGAGLGHIPGRGRQVSDGQGGYWIEEIDEAVPGDAYVLRTGRANVNHRLRAPHFEISLTAFGAHESLQVALVPDE